MNRFLGRPHGCVSWCEQISQIYGQSAVKIWVDIHWLAVGHSDSVEAKTCVRPSTRQLATLVNVVAAAAAAAAEAGLRMLHALLHPKHGGQSLHYLSLTSAKQQNFLLLNVIS